MCRVLAYIGPEIPVGEPAAQAGQQSRQPEPRPGAPSGTPQLAGWGFGAWGEHLLTPEEPFVYRRPMAAFYDDNAKRDHSEPSGQHAACSRESRRLQLRRPSWPTRTATPSPTRTLPGSSPRTATCRTGNSVQRELLQHCKDKYLKQMQGNTDTEFLYVLLLSLLESDSDEDVKSAFEEMVRLIAEAMKSFIWWP